MTAEVIRLNDYLRAKCGCGSTAFELLVDSANSKKIIGLYCLGCKRMELFDIDYNFEPEE